MSVWKVDSDTQNNYASIFLKEEEAYRQLPFFEGKPLGHQWIELEAKLDDGQIGDFSYFIAGMLACNSNALSVILPHTANEVEVLPIKVESFDYSLLNVNNVIDCLDLSRSKVAYFPTGRVMKVEDYVFHEEPLAATYLFKTPQLVRTKIYATDLFRDLVLANNLTGLQFRLC